MYDIYMPVIIQSRMCGGATAQQKGEASQLRTYVDDWNLAHAEEVSIRKLLNRIVHSGDKVPYQVYLGHEEPNMYADDPVSGARFWGAKNLYDPRAETLITRAEEAKLRAPATQAKKTANSQLLVAGISSQANRVKDRGRAKREQEERIEREAFEASEAGRRLREEAEEAEAKSKKDAEDKKKKAEDKKAQHKREVEERKVIREAQEAEDKIKKAEEEAEAKKAKAVKATPPPAPKKEVKVVEKTPPPPTPPETKKEEAPKKKKEKQKAPASASASAVDDDSWMTEALAFNATQKVPEKEVKKQTPREDFLRDVDEGLILVDNTRLVDRVLAGMICWDARHPVRVGIFCADYHTKIELITQGDKIIKKFGRKKCVALCNIVGRVLCNLASAKDKSGRLYNEAEKSQLFPQVLRRNFDATLKLNGWTDEELATLPVDYGLLDEVIVPIVWAFHAVGVVVNAVIADGVEMYPFVTNAPPKKK
jgi:hypothetical protein